MSSSDEYVVVTNTTEKDNIETLTVQVIRETLRLAISNKVHDSIVTNIRLLSHVMEPEEAFQQMFKLEYSGKDLGIVVRGIWESLSKYKHVTIHEVIARNISAVQIPDYFVSCGMIGISRDYPKNYEIKGNPDMVYSLLQRLELYEHLIQLAHYYVNYVIKQYGKCVIQEEYNQLKELIIKLVTPIMQILPINLKIKFEDGLEEHFKELSSSAKSCCIQ